jgi:DNA-binding NarL/FixJ family response regulator
MDAPARIRLATRRPGRKAFLFCKHPVAQEQFARLLQRGDFDVEICSELAVPEGFAVNESCLGVLDASDTMATLDFVRRLRHEQPSVLLLVLMRELDDSVTWPLLRLGVKGLLTYEQARRELARAACQVGAGMYSVPRELLTRFVESILPEVRDCKAIDDHPEISRRERDVLDLLLDNLSNKEIATRLFVSERTVKFHVSNLLGKFGVRRRADLIVLWMQRASDFPWLSRNSGQTHPHQSAPATTTLR